MTLFIKTNRAGIILFLLILFFTCGCVNSNDTMSLTQRIRERVMSQPAGKADDADLNPVYTALRNRQYDTVIKQAEKLKAAHPDDDLLYLLQGLANYFKNDYTSANNNLSKAIFLNGNRGDAYFLRSLSYVHIKQFQKALNDINFAIANPKTSLQMADLNRSQGVHSASEKGALSDLFYHRSRIYTFLKQTNSALKDINKAISTNPFPKVYNYYHRGILYFKQKKYTLAYNDFQKIVEINPETLNAWNMMGLINFFQGNYNKATEQYQKAHRLNPENMSVLSNLAASYWLQGNRKKAFEAMGKILKGKPSASDFYYFGYFCHLNGDQGKALANFEKANELNPDILKLRESFINRSPASSPTRKFYQDQFKTAKIYIETGKTPVAIANENRSPTLEITNFTLEPDPVPVNRPFDFHVGFKAYIPGSEGKKLATTFYFKILQNNKTLFKSRSYSIKVNNGKVNTRTQHMNPVPAKGVYTIKVFINHKKLQAEKSIILTIK